MYISYSFKNFIPQVCKSFPYLTTERFPHNWAIADMVKGYIAGMRKEHHCQAHEEEGHGEVTTKKITCSIDASDTEDDSPIENNSRSTPKSTKCLQGHNIDDASELEDDYLFIFSSQIQQMPSDWFWFLCRKRTGRCRWCSQPNKHQENHLFKFSSQAQQVPSDWFWYSCRK